MRYLLHSSPRLVASSTLLFFFPPPTLFLFLLSALLHRWSRTLAALAITLSVFQNYDNTLHSQPSLSPPRDNSVRVPLVQRQQHSHSHSHPHPFPPLTAFTPLTRPSF
ncbi:unnamed protein product [Mortierella alpina]